VLSCGPVQQTHRVREAVCCVSKAPGFDDEAEAEQQTELLNQSIGCSTRHHHAIASNRHSPLPAHEP